MNSEVSRGRGSPPVWTRIDTTIALVLLLVLVASSRIILSFDSHLYLASARSFGTTGVTTWYHWIREPLYPVFLKGTHAVFGSADLAVVALMSVLVVGSVALLGVAAFGHSPVARRVFIVAALLNPMVHGFIGHIGQQALMMCLLTIGVAWALAVQRNPPVPRTWMVISASLIGAASTLTNFILLPAVAAIGLSPIGVRWWEARRRSLRNGEQSIQAWPSLIMVAAACLALAGWWGYKAAVTDGFNPAFGGSNIWPWEITILGQSPPGPEVTLVDKLAGLTGFGPEQQVINGTIVFLPVATELMAYGGLDHEWSTDNCGVVYRGPEPVEAYAAEYFDLTCRPPWGGLPRAVLGATALASFRIGLIALVIALIVTPWRRSYLMYTLPALALLAPYAIGTLGISRYSFPLWPLGVAAGVSLIGDGAGRLRHLISKT